MCIKKGRDISLLFPFFVFGEKREERSYSGTSRTSYWGSTILWAFASVWMHLFCSYSCAVKREIVLKASTCVFFGYAQSEYR